MGRGESVVKMTTKTATIQVPGLKVTVPLTAEALPRDLEKAAQMSGWGTPLPAGRGRGIAIQNSFGSIVAEVAEVSVEGRDVRVHKVWCAIDCGFAANPSGVIAQMISSTSWPIRRATTSSAARSASATRG